MTVAINRLPDGTIDLTITIPWPEIKTAYDKFFNQAVGQVEVPGFRKGKAPKEMAEKKVDRTKVFEEVIKEIIPQYYTQAISSNNLKPIVNPKIELIKAKEDEDWQFKATICEKPKVDLGNYRQSISAVNKKSPIWVPGKDKEKPEEKEERTKTLGGILELLLKEAKVTLPDILLENEVNKMLSNLLDELQKLGLTVEQYLASKGKTTEQIRQEYREEAKKTLSLELILEEIAEKENITVSPHEIEDFIEKAPAEEKPILSQRRYFLASILRRQKTLDKLLNL